MVFDGDRKKRKICSPLFDSRKAGNLRFYFALGKGHILTSRGLNK